MAICHSIVWSEGMLVGGVRWPGAMLVSSEYATSSLVTVVRGTMGSEL